MASNRRSTISFPFRTSLPATQPNTEPSCSWRSSTSVIALNFIHITPDNKSIRPHPPPTTRSAVAIALGSLTIWHLKLIRRGETSIEAHINASETRRLWALGGKPYTNPYDFGARRNLAMFLGLVRGRTTVWRHLLLPSRHPPLTDGLTWPSVQQESDGATRIS